MKMIQVRNVPDDIHRQLKVRAAQRGVALTDYVLGLIENELAVPTLEEGLERVMRLPRPRATVSGSELVRAGRVERERELERRLRD
jgi:plasmid stability protein